MPFFNALASISSRAVITLIVLGCALSAGPAAAAGSDPYAPRPYVQLKHPDWSRNATLYQINLRQFTPEGTLRAAEQQLPRLKALGVDILWLMPIHPIGELHRKGGLGSPYAVRDYRAVNPELGSADDFKRFVASAHALGLRVILDWVANHTAWDNVLVKQHPEWYARDERGRFHPTPWYDWDDIIDLDYSQRGLRRYMTESLVYWVREFGVDGYRADAAGLVPLDFWEEAARQMRAVKPVFLLAEWESRDMHARAFDATYAWSWWDGLKHIAEGKADVTSLYSYYAWNRKFFPREAYRLLYSTNHDKNAWEGTEFEIFGAAAESVAVLSFISEGMPMIYNGQEAGNTKRLAFFERDSIQWRDAPEAALYRRLIALKKANTALWNGQWGAVMEPVANSAPQQVFSFVRANGKDKVVAVFNLSAKPAQLRLSGQRHLGRYRSFVSGEGGEGGEGGKSVDEVTLTEGHELTLAPWAYRVFVQ